MTQIKIYAAFENDGTQVSQLEFSMEKVMFSSLSAFIYECHTEEVKTNATEQDFWDGMPSSFLKIYNPITGEWIKNIV
jgi:hypothetical protein